VQASKKGKPAMMFATLNQIKDPKDGKMRDRDKPETEEVFHDATHYNTLQHAAAHCSTLQRAATHCNTLKSKTLKIAKSMTVTSLGLRRRLTLKYSVTLCHTLQHVATLCNTLQRSATFCHCNTLQYAAKHTKKEHSSTNHQCK